MKESKESEDKDSECEDERITAQNGVVLGPVRHQCVMKTPQAGGKPSGMQICNWPEPFIPVRAILKGLPDPRKDPSLFGKKLRLSKPVLMEVQTT